MSRRPLAHAPTRAAQAGYSLLETLLAIVLVAVVAFPLLDGLTRGQRFETHAAERRSAERLLRNEVERLRAAAPWQRLDTTSTVISAGGEADPAGPYRLEVVPATRCAGGTRSAELTEPLGGGCADRRAIVEYEVRVIYASAAVGSAIDTVFARVLAGSTGRFLEPTP